MDEHTFMVNRERAVDYLNSLDKVMLHLYTRVRKIHYSKQNTRLIRIPGPRG